MKCPCYECICTPICRHRKYYQMKKRCRLIQDYIDYMLIRFAHKDEAGNIHRRILLSVLKPTQWKIGIDGWVVDNDGIAFMFSTALHSPPS